MRRKLVFVLSCLLLLSCLLSVNSRKVEVKAPNGYPVHNLNTGLNYTRIQTAINASETLDGHTILVEAGTYYGHVAINKSISLIGKGIDVSVIDGNWSMYDSLISLTKDSINLTGFTIRNGQGLLLQNTSHSSVYANLITDNQAGIFLYDSANNTIIGNEVTASWGSAGIRLNNSSNNIIVGNNITQNENGIFVQLRGNSNNNLIYHNNLVNNTNQVVIQGEYSNSWDDGSEGNYWSDYQNKYPNASEINDSGVWDTPYFIDGNNQDNHPIIPEFPSFLILPFFMLTSLLAALLCRRKNAKESRQRAWRIHDKQKFAQV